MSHNDWVTPGAVPTLTDPQGGEAANAWNVSEMKTALPEEGAHGTQPATGAAHGQDMPVNMAEGWVDAQPYNYEAYATASAATWDGNARVYEFDGEAGEVGPEYPELELELFGDPKTRVSHGIDFSKYVTWISFFIDYLLTV